ncbi:hypothetical protein [Zobellella aerophila]|uniref:Uncharacterized protein n=1 Tax=Zobellella aerophila TaxID=870480 RepID=A0ABP6VI12_9GAMM
MSTWLWIALPLLFLVGLFVGALKDTKRIEKSVEKNRDKMNLKDWDTEESKKDNWGVPPGSYHPDDKEGKDKGNRE